MTSKLFASLSAIAALAALAPLSAQNEPIRFARYPHASHDKLAFSYHGDIWIAGLDGANPKKLTHHVASDRFPRFSPDGKSIAFTSDRMGNDDLWVVPTEGGAPRQVTFHTTGDTMLYWTPDGERLVFATSRGARAWGSPLHTVSANGDLPMPLDMDQGAAGMISQDGTKIAFNRFGMRYWRKGYRGNSNTDIFVQDIAAKTITQLTDKDVREFRSHTQDAYPMWGVDGMIYFMSERDGIFNIWKIAATGGDPVQVTKHADDGVQYPSISPDGKAIVYENDFRLWRLDVPGGQSQAIDVALGFDPKINLTSYLRSESKADGFTPSPDGDYVAVDFHGEVFIVPSDPKLGEKKQVTSSAWRDRHQVWSPDGKTLAYVSDESREEEIWLYDVESGSRRKVTAHQSQKRRPVWSKDSKQLAYVAANRLFVIDVDSGRNTELGYNEDGGYVISQFSPDGKWLVYSRRDADLNSEVFLLEIASRREHNVTQNPFGDSDGRLTPDGKTLVFKSTRDGGTNHLFRVSLAKLVEDSDDPLVRERIAREERDKKKSRRRGRGAAEEEEDEEDADEVADDAAAALAIDLDGIDRRAVQLTQGENGIGGRRSFWRFSSGSAGYEFSKDGKTIYFVSSDKKGSGFFSVSIDGGDWKRIADGEFAGFQMTADRKAVFYAADGGVSRMPIDSKKSKRIAFDFPVTVDRTVEWEQIFEESWRVMKYRFYDPEMHGVDWPAMRARYAKLLRYCGQSQDVYDLTNEMIGELNASHTGVRGPSDIEAPTTYRTRLLGLELEPHDGAFRIAHIHRDGPADKEWLDLRVGDYVLAIDGQQIKGRDNYWRILNHALNDYVTIDVAPQPHAPARAMRVATTASLRSVKYEEWVENNRDYVERISEGKIAYVHIRSMNQSSLERFKNEIDRFWNAQGIVIDIRFNGGGNIDQELLDILERKPYEYWNSRWGGRGWGRRPRQTIAGPKVMMINRRSGSDSEVTPLGFRDLGLGRIVGNPTAGAVIATGSYTLINGGRIRTPGAKVMTYDPTKPNNYGINLENYGVAPDVFVENTPADELRGNDRELETAVREALRMLGEGGYQYVEASSERSGGR